MFNDTNLARLEKTNPLVGLARYGAIVMRNNMTKSQFHKFLLENEALKIERNKQGIIYIHPVMTLNSAYNEGEAFFALKLWSKQNKELGKVYSPSAAFDLPDGSTHKADGAWISTEKLNQLSEEEKDSIALIVPDFVIETRSKTDVPAKLRKKMVEVWMANGVKLAWLIDPRQQKVWIYRADGSRDEISNFDQKISGEPILPGFELDLQELK